LWPSWPSFWPAAGSGAEIGAGFARAANCVVEPEAPGKPKERPLAYHLAAPAPHRRKPSPRRVAFDILFKGALLVSAMTLTFIVLVREERYAYGRQEIANQAMQQPTADDPGEIQIILPLN
jgi:hypothetical protein